jgi:Protein of unknown function (DUF4012)
MAAADPAPPRRPARARRKRLALAIWSGLATAGILLLLDGVLAGRSLVANLTRARSELNVGVEALVTGDAEGAGPHFAAAVEAADRATSAVGHPSLGLAGLLPIAGDNLDAAAGVAAASRETAIAGAAMVDVARTLGWSDVGLPAAEAAGSLDVEAMRAAVPRIDDVVGRLRSAVTRLEESGGGRLVGPVASGYRDAVERLAIRADVTTRLRDALRLIPTMFGADEARRYLFVQPTLGIPRPWGGAPSSLGVLLAEGGRIRLTSLDGSPGELTPATPAFADVAGSPDGPTAARRLLEAAETAGITGLDGVVWVDPVALEDLVWISGDVKVPGRPIALSDTTTTTALEVDALLGTAPRAAAELQASWAARVVQAFLRRRPGLESFSAAAAAATREGHLGVFLRDREEQRIVRALGLDQAVPRPRGGVLPLLATWSSDAGNHVGALVSTRIRHEVSIRDGGSARVRTEVTFDNGAAVEPPSVLLGRVGGPVPIGTFDADVALFLPSEARRVTAETSRPSPISIGTELGYARVRGSVSIRGGTDATLTVSYVVREVFAADDDGSRLVVRLVPQPSLEGVSYVIRILVPEGTVVSSASPELQRSGGALTFRGVRTDPLDLELVVA